MKKNIFKKTTALQSFDFGAIEGVKKTERLNKKIHYMMINHPDQPVGPGGESFNRALDRSSRYIKKILQEPGNTLIVSHNSMLNMIELWYRHKANKDFCHSQEFRKQYTDNKVKKNTGSCFMLAKENGGLLYLVRHGDTTDTVLGVYSTKDGILTNQGVREAQKIGKFLKNKKIDSVHTSHLIRTVQTTKIILKEIEK